MKTKIISHSALSPRKLLPLSMNIWRAFVYVAISFIVEILRNHVACHGVMPIIVQHCADMPITFSVPPADSGKLCGALPFAWERGWSLDLGAGEVCHRIAHGQVGHALVLKVLHVSPCLLKACSHALFVQVTGQRVSCFLIVADAASFS